MSDPRDPSGPSREDDGIDVGQPIEELAKLREDPSDRFPGHVLDGINRRMLTAQAMETSWVGITRVLMEYIQMLMSALGVRDTDDKEERVDG